MDLLDIMKAISDETRIRILNLLKDGELCVCELEHILDINQSNASRHLTRLTSAKVVCYEKRALYVYYKVNEAIYNQFPFMRYFIKSEIGKLEKCKNDTNSMIVYKQSGLGCDELTETSRCNN